MGETGVRITRLPTAFWASITLSKLLYFFGSRNRCEVKFRIGLEKEKLIDRCLYEAVTIKGIMSSCAHDKISTLMYFNYRKRPSS